jgi:phosphatidylglycerophosphatase A
MNISASEVFKNPIYFLAFGFGSGLSKTAPGTMGTLAAIPLYLVLHFLSLPFYIAAILFFTIAGIWICDITGKKIGIADYPGIVWDEICGFLWVMCAVPFHWYGMVLGFILFRLFDIWKPWPISLIDKNWHGGFGVMADDLLAAVYAGIILHVVLAMF